MTETIDLRFASQKAAKLLDAIRDTAHIQNGATGLAAYHAAKKAISAQTRVGFERRLSTTKAAMKQFNVIVGTAVIDDMRLVRIHVPAKRLDVILGA